MLNDIKYIDLDRFNVSDIIGRTVIIHNMAEDFTSQPSGNAEKKSLVG